MTEINRGAVVRIVGRRGFVAFSLLVAMLVPAISLGDEIDDLLTKRQNNFAHLKKMRAEYVVETERPAIKGEPARKVGMKYSMTIRHRDRKNPDPAKRFNVEMEMQEPLQMHTKFENGIFSYLTPSGKWVIQELSEDAQKFLADLPEAHSVDAKSAKEHYDIKRRKDKDSLFGGKKGMEYISKGKSKMYARKIEIVDSETGQPLLVEHYDESGKVKWRMKVNKMGKHNGVSVAEDVETESEGAVGIIKKRTKVVKVEVETE